MKLDDRLQDILEDWYPGTMYEEVIPKLKQAFTEAGYVQITVEQEERWKEADKIIRGSDYLSGQEWYERFKIEIQDKRPMLWHDNKAIYADITEAARRAAGLEDKDV